MDGEEYREMSRRIAGSAMVERVKHQASAMLYRLGNRVICPEKGVQTVDKGMLTGLRQSLWVGISWHRPPRKSVRRLTEKPHRTDA